MHNKRDLRTNAGQSIVWFYLETGNVTSSSYGRDNLHTIMRKRLRNAVTISMPLHCYSQFPVHTPCAQRYHFSRQPSYVHSLG